MVLCGLHGVVFITLFLLVDAQRAANTNPQSDYQELTRQNLITQQILQYFLQRRLGITGKTETKPPSIHEILPRNALDTGGVNILQGISNEHLEQLLTEDDNLQSVESEQVNSIYQECTNCEEEPGTLGVNRWTMPLLKLGEKKYYLGIFFKANWYRAAQYCRFHGMHLASISTQEENDKLEKYVKDSGYGNEHFWTSGTDLAEEGSFFWMANGRPLTFVNWNAGEPNNFRYENGEEENCLELWNRDGKGLKWNDSPCSFETYFVCEVRTD